MDHPEHVPCLNLYNYESLTRFIGPTPVEDGHRGNRRHEWSFENGLINLLTKQNQILLRHLADH
jgi:hypothetical protein